MTRQNEDQRIELERMLARDPFAQLLGVSLESAGGGAVRLSMTLREEHLNFHGSAHGGVLFSFADTAFGLASNSRGVVAVGIHTDMAYIAPAAGGETLQADAEEVSCSRRVGVYRVTVSRRSGGVVGIFTGTVYRTGKPHD